MPKLTIESFLLKVKVLVHFRHYGLLNIFYDCIRSWVLNMFETPIIPCGYTLVDSLLKDYSKFRSHWKKLCEWFWSVVAPLT